MSESNMVRIEPETFKVGNETWVIARDDSPVAHVDLICEARHHNGTVYLSLAQTIIDANSTPKAVICSRVRMNLATAQAVHGLLGDMIKQALTPPDKSQAN